MRGGEIAIMGLAPTILLILFVLFLKKPSRRRDALFLSYYPALHYEKVGQTGRKTALIIPTK